MVAVILTGLLALTADLIWYKKSTSAVRGVSLIGLLVSGALVVQQWYRPDEDVLARMVTVDRFGLAIQLILIISCFLCLLFSDGYLKEKRIAFKEFYPLALWSTAGGMLMATSKNLLVIFLGLEVLSIALYVMAGMSRSEHKSEESALKYFLLGSFASGFLLYGIAFVYGATGGLNLDEIASAWSANNLPAKNMLLFGLGLLLVGLGFKSAFVPFHQWTPDVYQGVPTNVTAFMAAVSKIAAIAALYRVLHGMLPLKDLWIPALTVVAILTMTVGNLVALTQKDVKRILGYSSIAHAGYLLVGLLAHFSNPGQIGVTTVLYYLLAYSLMTIGTLAIVSMVAKDGREETTVASFNGLWKQSPLAAGVLIIFMSSMIGIPITAGFVGKFQIFVDSVNANLGLLAIALAINSVISIAYYLGIAKAAFVADDDSASVAKMNSGLSATVAICAAGVLLIGVLFAPISQWLGNDLNETPVVALNAGQATK